MFELLMKLMGLTDTQLKKKSSYYFSIGSIIFSIVLFIAIIFFNYSYRPQIEEKIDKSYVQVKLLKDIYKESNIEELNCIANNFSASLDVTNNFMGTAIIIFLLLAISALYESILRIKMYKKLNEVEEENKG
ncbi:hypothetical protein [Sulfurimonas marina]|uniref:Uncharacterized protein n=1 Tax=Sulfurimonas marina TaxID=2590551 RepID=A0A7M1AVC9_9BACT|nr:hypothetical protein [Sulfurimonas marina]QOP41393.1 hypothetical protein FJR03_06400 [Sulfurimonas marina]